MPNAIFPVSNTASASLIFLESFGAFFVAVLLMLGFGNRVIRYFTDIQGQGQPIRLDIPSDHLAKRGTPTAGGVLILPCIFIGSLLWTGGAQVWLSLFIMISFGCIGFYDDYLKLTRRSHRGATGRLRLFMEFGVALLALICYDQITGALVTDVILPFFNIAIGFGPFYYVFASAVIVCMANAVNVTDGLDGLAIFPVFTTAAAIVIVLSIAEYGSEYTYLLSIAPVLYAIMGAGLGFLWFNAHPAKIFMGDTGALGLGGVLGVLAVIAKLELIIAIMGGIFVIEAFSVVIQVASFKSRGKRIFLMAPIHHHFEKLGWKESQIVVRFWITSILFAILGIFTCFLSQNMSFYRGLL